MNIYQNILQAKKENKRLLAVLIDPDKMTIALTRNFINKVNQSLATHIFVGGSTVVPNTTETLVATIKKHTTLPVIIFPGDISQITNKANGILYLSLISGNNPEYLINKQIQAVPYLKKTTLEIISTGYILVESNTQTAVQRVSKTQPIARSNIRQIVNTAKAGEYLGMKLIYLEAGSGAKKPITKQIIQAVKANLQIPLIVGGGIKTAKQLEQAYQAGANLVVIGNILEKNESFFNNIKK